MTDCLSRVKLFRRSTIIMYHSRCRISFQKEYVAFLSTRVNEKERETRQKKRKKRKKLRYILFACSIPLAGKEEEKKRVARKKVVVLEFFLSSYPSSTSEKSGRTIQVTATSVILFFFPSSSSSSSSHFTRARSPYPPVSLSLSRCRSSLRPFFLSRWRSLCVSGIRPTILRNGSYFLTACQCFRSRSPSPPPMLVFAARPRHGCRFFAAASETND